MGVGGQCHVPAALHPGKPGNHRTGRRVGLTVSLKRVEDFVPPLGFDHRNAHATRQSVYRLSYPGPKAYQILRHKRITCPHL